MCAAAAHPPEALRPLEDRHADRLIERAVEAGFTALVAETPRAWIDLNRAPEDYDWPRLLGEPPQPVSARAAAGIGIVPDRLQGLGSLWRTSPTRDEIGHRLRSTHEPYHATLTDLLTAVHDRFGQALLLDIHSMPLAVQGRANMVLGTRRGRSVSAEWVSVARAELQARGRRVTIDHPYQGAHIAEHHGRPSVGRHILQIETCRSLYLDSKAADVSSGLGRCQADILTVASRLSEQLQRRYSWPLAAE